MAKHREVARVAQLIIAPFPEVLQLGRVPRIQAVKIHRRQPSSPSTPCYRTWARKSTDGGATWLADMPFSDVVSPLPLAGGSAYDYSNNVLTVHLHAWVDGRNPIDGASQADVYFDREPIAVRISGTVSYCSNPVPGPVSNVTLNLIGDTTMSTLSDGSGNYQFSSLASGGTYTVTPHKATLAPGSVGIDTVDVVATQRHFLVIGTPLSGCRLTAADVNGDSVVNTVDAVAIQRFFLIFPTGIANVGKYQFMPPSRTYMGIVMDQTGQNYDTLVYGDVATSYVH